MDGVCLSVHFVSTITHEGIELDIRFVDTGIGLDRRLHAITGQCRRSTSVSNWDYMCFIDLCSKSTMVCGWSALDTLNVYFV